MTIDFGGVCTQFQSGAAPSCAGGDWRRAISRAAFPSNASNSSRQSAFKGGDAALGKAFLSKRVCKRSRMSQPPKSSARKRNASRAMRRTRLRVAARGANFLPMTSPSRADWPVGLAYTTKCGERRHGRKRKTDENSSVLRSLAALGKVACARNGLKPDGGIHAPREAGRTQCAVCLVLSFAALRWPSACGPSRGGR
jgi:hypothetical protein